MALGKDDLTYTVQEKRSIGGTEPLTEYLVDVDIPTSDSIPSGGVELNTAKLGLADVVKELEIVESAATNGLLWKVDQSASKLLAYQADKAGSAGSFMPKGTGALTEEDLTATGDHGQWICMRGAWLRRVGFLVTTAVAADNTAPVVEFAHRSTPGGSDSSIKQLTISDGTSAGSFETATVNQEFKEGEELNLKVATAAADSGTAAGNGFYMFELEGTQNNASGTLLEFTGTLNAKETIRILARGW